MIHTVNVRTKKDAIRHPLTLAYIWRNLTAPWQQFCFGKNMYIFKPPSYCFRVKRKIYVPQGTFHIAFTTFHAQSVFHNPVRIYFIEKNDLLKASRLFLEAPPGFEPGDRGVADLCLTTWPWRHITKDAYQKRLLLERKTRFELATFTLAR